MSAPTKPSTPLLEEADGPTLVGLINRLAEAFGDESLSVNEALLLYWIIERIEEVLWQQHRDELMKIARERLAAIEDTEDDEPDEGPDGEPRH